MTKLSKRCAKCCQFKPRHTFPKDANRPDGRYPYCKECKRRLNGTPERAAQRARDLATRLDEGAKTCTRCQDRKPFADFYPDKRATDGLASCCKACHSEHKAARMRQDPERERALVRAADARRRADDPDKPREKARRLARQIKNEVLAHYGAHCACCGTDRDLTVDHVNGGGTQHRKSVSNSGNGFYYWLKRSGWPAGFQTLCRPCNTSKGANYQHCRLMHRNRWPTGTGWPNDDGKTCSGAPRNKVNGTGSVSRQLRSEIALLRAQIARLESRPAQAVKLAVACAGADSPPSAHTRAS